MVLCLSVQYASSLTSPGHERRVCERLRGPVASTRHFHSAQSSLP